MNRRVSALIGLAQLLVRWAAYEIDRGDRSYGGKAWRSTNHAKEQN